MGEPPRGTGIFRHNHTQEKERKASEGSDADSTFAPCVVWGESLTLAHPQFPFISCRMVIVIMEVGCDDLDEMQLRQVARKGPSMQ